MSEREVERNVEILCARAMGVPLRTVAARFGLSHERVRQIERRERFLEWRDARAYGFEGEAWRRALPVLDAIASAGCPAPPRS